MLVLTRKLNEKILVGKNIVISILEIEGNNVKIGIDAPKEISILRMEVFEKIQNENIAASSKEMDDISGAVDLMKKKFSKEQKE
jgi:carbon storage regulator